MRPFVALRSLLQLSLACVLVGCGGRVSMPPDPEPDLDVVDTLRAGGGGATGGETATTQSTGTGWGTLKGKFTFDGTPPTLDPLAVTKENNVCGNSVPNQELIVDPGSKGIANVVIYARKVSRKNPDAKHETPPPFDQKQCMFLTHVYALQVSDPLVVKNSDPTGHNTNISPPGNPQENPLLTADSEFVYQFRKPLAAPVAVTCSIHPWMKAYVLARDDPYFAVTKPDGTFEIANLPAGEEIEFQVWHERAPNGLQGKGDWSRGRFTMTIPADETATLDVAVPSSAFQ